MIRGGATLYRLAQEFFETELCGVFRYDQTRHLPRENTEAFDKKSRYPYGKYKESIRMRFGDYELKIDSPLESPPLGRAVLTREGDSFEGPLDTLTWQKMGRIVRSEHIEDAKL